MSKAAIVNEIHRTVMKNFPRRHVLMKDIDDLWQADLLDMQKYSKENSQYKFILAVIDTFSKYAWLYPLKNKNKESVSCAFKKLFEEGRIPKNLQTDLGTEFYNTNLKKLFEKYKINHYSTYSTKKASIVERFIRTLKNKIYKQFSLQGNYRWKNILYILLKQYNSRFHRTIQTSPDNVNKQNKENILKIYKTLQISPVLKKRSTLKIGDYVRISKYKGTFDKGYTPNWSTEIFTIKTVQNTNPVTYLLTDSRKRPILGAFYRQELQKTSIPDIYLIEKVLKRKGNRLFVKWLGLPSDESSWVKKSDVL